MRKFGHARIASYVALHKADFTRYCAEIAGDRLPVPSHDTYLWYIAARRGWDMLRINVKRKMGLTA